MHCFLFVTLLLTFSGISLQQETTSSDAVTLLWTGLYQEDRRTTVSQLSRDPREQGHSDFPTSDLFSYRVGGLGAIESDSQRQRIFFQNFQQNYIGVHHMDNNVTQQYFAGMVKDVEELAYDWLTGNLYWTDHGRNLIMVVEETLTHYSILKRLNPNAQPHGLALHPTQRLLFFSVRMGEKSMMYKCDLACSSPQLILSNPTISHVSSISIDGDRLYWLDLDLPDFRVRSSDLHGSNVRTLLSDSSASFEGIASFRGIVYVTDGNPYYKNGKSFYKMHMFVPQRNKYKEYRLQEEPRKVVFYSDGLSYPREAVTSRGECDIPGQDPCDHICLPRLNDARLCACANGYRKVGETQCAADPLSDDVLLVVDDAQKKIFQLSLNGQSYQVLPIASKYDRKVVTMSLDPQTKAVYWSDRNSSTIYKLPFSSDQPTVVKEGMHAQSMAVDPITGNVYFSAENSGYIYVMNENGKHLKTLMQPTEPRMKYTIRKMQVDYVNRHLYWLEPFVSFFAQGRIRRMPLNGGEPEVVVSGLFDTNSFDINYESSPIKLEFCVEDFAGVLWHDVSIYLLSIQKNGTVQITILHQSLFYHNRGNQFIKVPLSSLPIVHRANSASFKTYYLGPTLRYFRILDFKVVGGTIYFTMKHSEFLKSYNSARVQPLMDHKKAFFFNPIWLEAYRPYHYFQQSAPVLSTCRNSVCAQLCFTTTSSRPVCDCDDNHTANGFNCIAKHGEDIDMPPEYDSCPSDSTITLPPCQHSTPLNIQPPQWTDDITATAKLRIFSPTIVPNYPPGHHHFIFIAKDEYNHTSFCSFTVNILTTTCSFRFNSRFGDVITSQPNCSDGLFTHTISCAHDRQMLFYKGSYFKSLRNICSLDGKWEFSSEEELSCLIPPVTTTTTTTSTSPASTRSTTTARQTTTTTSSTTTTTTTTATSTTITPTTTTISKATRTATTRISSSSTSTVMSPRKGSTKPTATTSSSFQDGSQKPKALQGAQLQPSSGNSSLASGSVAAVAVVSVVVFIALIASLIVVMRRKYFVPMSNNRNGFRLFWNTSETTEMA